MQCWWCHNPESQEVLPGEMLPSDRHNCLRPFYRPLPYQKAWEVTVADLLTEIRKDLIFYEESGGGVTASGGEPLLQPEFLKDLLQACKSENLHTVVDTSGLAPWKSYQEIVPLVDIFLYDLKFVDDQRHQKYTGVSNKMILENLQKLTSEGKRIIIRIPLIPAITDVPENLTQIAEYLSALSFIKQIDLLPYNPMGEQKYKKLNKNQKIANLKHQTKKDLEQMKLLFQSHKFQVTIGG